MTISYLEAHRIVLEIDEIDRRQREASCNGTEVSEYVYDGWFVLRLRQYSTLFSALRILGEKGQGVCLILID
jgi:hypothetical protein